MSGIVNQQAWTRLNSYAAHSVFWARRIQDDIQIMRWRYSVKLRYTSFHKTNSTKKTERETQRKRQTDGQADRQADRRKSIYLTQISVFSDSICFLDIKN